MPYTAQAKNEYLLAHPQSGDPVDFHQPDNFQPLPFDEEHLRRGRALNLGYYAYEGINYIPDAPKHPIEYFFEDPKTGIGNAITLKQDLNDRAFFEQC